MLNLMASPYDWHLEWSWVLVGLGLGLDVGLGLGHSGRQLNRTTEQDHPIVH